MKREKLEERVSVSAWAFAVAFEARLAEELRELDMTVSGFRLVGELMRAPQGLRTGDLARRLGIKPPSVTTMVARLVEAGIARVEADAADARATRVCLAKDAPLGGGIAIFERLDKKLFGKASTTRKRELADALGEMLANLGGVS